MSRYPVRTVTFLSILHRPMYKLEGVKIFLFSPRDNQLIFYTGFQRFQILKRFWKYSIDSKDFDEIPKIPILEIPKTLMRFSRSWSISEDFDDIQTRFRQDFDEMPTRFRWDFDEILTILMRLWWDSADYNGIMRILVYF